MVICGAGDLGSRAGAGCEAGLLLCSLVTALSRAGADLKLLGQQP